MRAVLPAVLPAALLAMACTGSKPLSKKAAKLDAAGMYAEAADLYLQSARRNLNNIDAKIGLKKTGQQVLNDKLGTFFRQVAMDEDKEKAVNAYLEARDYQRIAGSVGVQLEIPDHYQKDFERVKGEHLLELYELGQSQLEQQRFADAERTFEKIAKLEPGYKDAGSLRNIAYLEPLYRSGKEHLEAGRYRRAYADLDRVVQKDAAYKDASSLRQRARDLGQFSVAVLPFTSSAKRPDLTARLQASAISALTQQRDPFLRVVDRENMDRILEEQRLSLSGVVDDQTAVRVGNLMGAQAVLIGTLIDHREVTGPMQRSTKNGFESYRVEAVNKETGEKYFETRYKPVKYLEFYQENKVFLSFSYRLVSLETGEVILSKVVDRESADHAYYATYDGNKELLFPARNNVVDPTEKARRDLRQLLNAPREVKSVATLTTELVSSTTSSLAAAVVQELNNRLP